jgi:tRNA nucleotidyltransferase (CCA-adding enzyme)
MFGFGRINMFMADPYWRKPQPSTWNEILFQRDGANSGATVTVFRSTQSGAPGAVTNPRTRQIFEQKVSSLEDLKNFGVTNDKELLAEDEKGKELLVIVKRGRSANIVERDGPPYESEEDIRHWAHGMTWAEIRRQCIGINPSLTRIAGALRECTGALGGENRQWIGGRHLDSVKLHVRGKFRAWQGYCRNLNQG